MKKLIVVFICLGCGGAVVAIVWTTGGMVPVYRQVDLQDQSTSSAAGEAPSMEHYTDVIAEDNKQLPAVEEEEALLSPPDCVLKSVFMVSSGGKVRGFAAIESKGIEKLYSEGDQVDGYTIIQIGSDHAVLKQGIQTFRLERGAAAVEKQSAGDSAVTFTEDAEEGSSAAVSEPDADIAEPVEFFHDSGLPSDLIYVRREVFDYAAKNLHKLMHDVRIRTDLSGEGGSMRGLRIDPEKESLPDKMGFKAGDTIRSVNGRAMNSITDVMEMYRKFTDEPPDKIEVQFERDGQNRIRVIEIGE